MENMETNVNVNEETQIEKSEHSQVEGSKNEATEVEEKMIPQSKVDEIINKKYAKLVKKFEEEKEQTAKQAREAEKLERMTEAERMAEKLSALEKKLEAKEKEEARKSLESATLKELSTRGIDADFLDFVIAEDAETTKQKLDIFTQKYNAMVDAKVDSIVKERLRGEAPKTVTNNGEKTLSAFEAAFKSDKY